MPAGTLSEETFTAHIVQDPDRLERLLQGIGALDLVVDLRPANLQRYQQTWARIGFYLRGGGCYIVRPADLRWGVASRILSAWAMLLGGAAYMQIDDSIAGSDNSDLARAALVQPEGLIVVKRDDHLIFVRDQEIAAYLPRRNPPLSMAVLAELPPGVLHGRAEVTSHESSGRIVGLGTELRYPALQLRHYEGRVAFYGNTLLISGNVILPDTHRFFRMVNPPHPQVKALPSAPRYGTFAEQWPHTLLAGTYYLLDPFVTGHYGHLMTEAIPRLWGWDLAKQRYPDLKALTMISSNKSSEPVLDRLLPAYGIDPADLVYIDTPVELESLVTASGMWHNSKPFFAHPDVVDIWKRIARRLVEPSAPTWERIFLTRPTGSWRTCHNAPAVEALFRSYGFEVFRPEDFDLGVQAGLFRTAKVIAGFAGSQMFNLMYATSLQQLIVLAQERYLARNEHLYSSLLGGRADWFWSPADHPQFQSDWSFDFERNGAELEKLLASL